MSDPSQCSSSVALFSSARDRLSADDDTLKIPDRLFGNSENQSLSQRDSERIQRTDSVALIWGVNFGEFHSQTSQCLLRAAGKRFQVETFTGSHFQRAVRQPSDQCDSRQHCHIVQ